MRISDWSSDVCSSDLHVAEFMREWQDMGTVHMRVTVSGWAEECERDWKRAHDAGEFDEPFDWEWCPRWLAQRLEAVYPAPAAPVEIGRASCRERVCPYV